MITDELASKGAPEHIIKIGRRVDEFLEAGLDPPAHLVHTLQAWVGKANTQDRYGQ